MLDAAILCHIIEEHYLIHTTNVHLMREAEGKFTYRLDLPNGQQWVARVYPSDYDLEKIEHHATTLISLQTWEFPAERLIFAADGPRLVTHDGWHILVTAFIVGTLPTYAPATLYHLGAVLGKLHAIGSTTSAGEAIAWPAMMLPCPEIAWASAQLMAVATQVPVAMRSQYDDVLAVLGDVHFCEDLPTVLIHNDYHPSNVLQMAPGNLAVIDWDGAGLGPAVLDVGFLLVSCDVASPFTPPLLPDPARVNAIVAGYCQHHALAEAELARLSDAIRFRSLVFGVADFAAAIADGREMDVATTWWWRRYLAADEIAERAARRFAEHQR